MVEKAKKNDYEKIQRYLESVYGHSYNFFPLRYPQTWKKDNTDFKNILLLKEKGEIVSLVRIFPITLILDGIEVNFAGIGAVSTSYLHRGKGYMSTLLNESFKEMRKQKFPLSILWGDRHRYKNFGYEVAGKKVYIIINSRGLNKNKIESDKGVKRFQGEKEVIKKIIMAYNAHPYRKKRKKEEFEEIFKIISSATYYLDKGKKFAYVSIAVEARSGVLEYGGDENLILKILKYLEERFGISNFYLPYPDFECVPQAVLSTCSGWEIKPEGMLKIIDLYQTLKCFSSKFLKLPEGFEVTFSMENQSVTLRKKKGRIEIKKGKGKNEILLNEIDMVRFLFGTSFWKPENVNNYVLTTLKAVLPINIFVWNFDNI